MPANHSSLPAGDCRQAIHYDISVTVARAATFALFQSVSNCGRITDEGVRSLCTSRPIADSLTVLELDSCVQVTDDCLTHIAACHRLQRLEVFDNRQITRPAIEQLMVSLLVSQLVNE